MTEAHSGPLCKATRIAGKTPGRKLAAPSFKKCSQERPSKAITGERRLSDSVGGRRGATSDITGGLRARNGCVGPSPWRRYQGIEMFTHLQRRSKGPQASSARHDYMALAGPQDYRCIRHVPARSRQAQWRTLLGVAAGPPAGAGCSRSAGPSDDRDPARVGDDGVAAGDPPTKS